MIKDRTKRSINFESLEGRILLTQSLSLDVSTSVANYERGDSDVASLIKSHETSLSGSANAESTYDNSSEHLLSRLNASVSGSENVAGSIRSGTFSITYDARRVSTVVGDVARIRTAFSSSIGWELDASGAEDLGYSYEVTLDVARSGEGPFRGDSTPLQLGLPNGQIVGVEGAGSTTYKGELSPATNRPAPLGLGAGGLRQDSGGIVDTQGQVRVTITYKIIYKSPDIALTSLTLDVSGGADFGYAVSGADLPTATTVALYWAGGTTFDTKIGGPITSTTTPTAVGTYGPVHVDVAKLGTPPAAAKYLLAVADPDGKVAESDETNNVRALAIQQPDIASTTLAFATDGGVDFAYTVQSAALPSATIVGLYWSPTPSYDPAVAALAYSTPATKAIGTYPVHVAASSLTTPPPGAKYLLAVADPANSIAESDEANNVRFVEIRRPDIAVQKGGLDWSKYRGAGITDPERGVDLTYQIL